MAQDRPVLEHFRNEREGDAESFKAELMSYGLFVYPDLLKSVASLSVGQKRKLQLATLLTTRANVLLLDEPTNHLSLDVLESFENALADFEGPVVAVSHDRHFIERFAREIWEVADGAVRVYPGGWPDYARHHGLAMMAEGGYSKKQGAVRLDRPPASW